ncbi:collagen alpha-2(I) chain-like [Lutra lutra]|uniref:collagen alpha-2(I) chain-like n=1 Tax=Lutra lutra TaxID=9657 RepID=UPI001FD4937D|nr:collagen alpha-2(I) chain-like [Lutra lutra]
MRLSPCRVFIAEGHRKAVGSDGQLLRALGDVSNDVAFTEVPCALLPNLRFCVAAGTGGVVSRAASGRQRAPGGWGGHAAAGPAGPWAHPAGASGGGGRFPAGGRGACGGQWALPAPGNLSVSARPPLRAVAGGCGKLAGPLHRPALAAGVRGRPLRVSRRCRGLRGLWLPLSQRRCRRPPRTGHSQTRVLGLPRRGRRARGLRARCSVPGPGVSLRPVAPAPLTALATQGSRGRALRRCGGPSGFFTPSE